ncbi:MAG TPA: phosphoglucosamine mutase, partial [Erysipelotrichaceae bacterium]|nr:phosphoglucosamine mutase [Erysipelotrichaceae bacterium]
KNVKVKDKQKALHDRDLLEMTNKIQEELGDEGRILVRPSGTEPLVRVMVEAKTDELCAKYVGQCVALIQSKGI